MNTIGLYFHVPFCSNKCDYCNFYSLENVNNQDLKLNYTNSIILELEKHRNILSNKLIDTIYFGGGTPPVLGVQNLSKILKYVLQNFQHKDISMMEISLESNPDSLSSEDMIILNRAGFNRISFGVQSIVQNELDLIGRRKDNNIILSDLITSANQAGFKNISIDLMIGLPEQNINSLSTTLNYIMGQNIQHISAYILKLEEDTPLYRKRDLLNIPDEDYQADLYLYTVKFLRQHGFKQYEISNFCKDNFECQHNLKYWNTDEYLGIGPSAHSMVNNKRFYYPNSINNFIELSNQNNSDNIVQDGEGNTLEEYCMLRLRLSDGLDLNIAKQKGLSDIQELEIISKAKELKKYGLCNIENNKIYLTQNGFLISNSCIIKLLENL